MIKQLFLILLFPILLSAQNVWYVDTERSGAGTYDGTSWATAWNRFNSVDYWGSNSTGIVWSSISAGDTIYISGGADSVLIDGNVEGAYGTCFRFTGQSDFTSGNPLIITKGKDAGHNGDVWFINNTSTENNLWIRNISNVKLVGLNINNTISAVQVGTGDAPVTDSLITFEDCHLVGIGLTGLVGSSAKGVTFKRCILENLDNAYPNDQDPFGFNSGGGHLIDSCTIIVRNDYELIDDTLLTDGSGMTANSNSLMDTDLNMVDNYHVNNSVWVNGYYLQITSNTSNTFYGDAGWQFDVITQNNPAAVVVTVGALQDNNSESHNPGTLVGAIIELASGDTLVITSNSGTSFTGSGGWLPNSNPASNQTYIIRGGTEPFDGLAWTMGGAHRDIIQISNMLAGASTDFTVSNSLIIDTKEGGTGWNNIIYNYSDLETPHVSFNFYNNIIVSRKNKTSPGAFAIGGNYSGSYTRWNSVKILNNTIMTKGAVGGFFTSWTIDTLILRNNLIISDTIASQFYNPENSSGLFSSVVKDINNNKYAEYGGVSGNFAVNIGTYDFAGWQGLGLDVNSTTDDSRAITFVNKYGLNITDYYTTAGRDSGVDLSATYPFLSTDILGNPRTGNWDIGALEYVSGAVVDSTPSNVNFITDYLNTELNTAYTGHIADLTGFDSGYVHIDRGYYNVDGGAWKNHTQWTMVYPTNDIYVRDTSSTEYHTTKTITVTIGNASDTWTLRTKSASNGLPIVKGSNGFLIKSSNGMPLRFSAADTTSPSQPDTTPPLPPISFVAIGGTSQTQFQTNWANPTATDLDSIRYYEGSSNDTTTMSWIVSLPAVTGYLRTGRTANTTYWCAVKAVDDSGNVSYFSNVDSATTSSTAEGGTPLANLDLAYLTQSFAAHLYDHSPFGNAGTTTMQAEMTAYNTANGSDGSLTRIEPDYPAAGDMIWHWNQVFYGGTAFSNTQNVITEYANTSTYDILQVTFGFNSAALVDIPLDTVTYPQGHILQNYKYWIRNMVAAMELHLDKYWILWNIPPEDQAAGNSSADVLTQAQFNTWMVDTLQAGLDSYGAFPSNVYIFDIFSLLKNSGDNWMNPTYSDNGNDGDSHPNENGSSYVAPIYIQEVFDHARAYRIP